MELTSKALHKMGRATERARVLLVGVTYKADVSDIRESSALDVWLGLERLGAVVSCSDP